jgi:fructokinase
MSASSTKTNINAENPAWIAAVEAGGTSFVVAICKVTSQSATTLPQIVHRFEADSSRDSPKTTLEACTQFLEQHRPPRGYHALGIASFGPLGVDESNSANYGKILASSPKKNWRNVDLSTPLKKACQGTSSTGTSTSLPLKIKIDTDVNAPAVAEHLHSGKNLSSMAYITVGTGVGVGLVVNHKPVHGRMHPEAGHVPVQVLPGDAFGGYSWGEKSPFRGQNTVEGLACAVALTERYEQMMNTKVEDRSILATLPDDHEIWDHAANALANLCATLLLTVSMEHIVLGGGLMNRKGLLEKIQERTVQIINGYLELPSIKTIITKSQFGSDAGLVGTIVLAQTALLQMDQAKVQETKAKREAFNVGMWYGFLTGAVGAGLVCKYWVLPKRK